MRTGDKDFLFGINYNFSTDTPLQQRSVESGSTFPPVSGDLDLLDGTDFLLLDGTKFLLL